MNGTRQRPASRQGGSCAGASVPQKAGALSTLPVGSGFSIRRSGSRGGVTLIEIILSIFILMVGIISIASVFPVGIKCATSAMDNTHASMTLETACAAFKTYAADAIWPGYPYDGVGSYNDIKKLKIYSLGTPTTINVVDLSGAKPTTPAPSWTAGNYPTGFFVIFTSGTCEGIRNQVTTVSAAAAQYVQLTLRNSLPSNPVAGDTLYISRGLRTGYVGCFTVTGNGTSTPYTTNLNIKDDLIEASPGANATCALCGKVDLMSRLSTLNDLQTLLHGTQSADWATTYWAPDQAPAGNYHYYFVLFLSGKAKGKFFPIRSVNNSPRYVALTDGSTYGINLNDEGVQAGDMVEIVGNRNRDESGTYKAPCWVPASAMPISKASGVDYSFGCLLGEASEEVDGFYKYYVFVYKGFNESVPPWRNERPLYFYATYLTR